MKIYYGWYVVAISVLVLALAIGGSIQAFGLFVLPVSEEFELSRADVNTGAILFNLGMACAGPVLGRILDRHSARLMMAISAVLFGGGLIVLGLSRSIWLSSLVITVPLAAAAVGLGTVTSPTLVARWFTRHRARAMAIAMLGISLGPVVVVPLVGLLIEAVGWRQSLVVLGVASGALLLLLVPLVRERPGPGDVEVRSGAADTAPAAAIASDVRPMRIGEMLRLPQFWTIALASALAFGIMQVIIVSLVPFGQEQGLTLAEGASLMSMFGGSAMAGSLLLAGFGDRLDRLTLLVVLTLLIGATGASLLLAGGYSTTLACTFAIGLVCGAFTPAQLALIADRLGAASFGTASGAASFLSTLVSAACIRAAGEMYDRTGNYRLTFLAFLAVGLVAASLMAATGPFSRRYPAPET